MPALALTDLANVFGLVKFYSAARSKGIKPLLGSDVFIANDSDADRPYRLLLLCRSQQGYLQLCELLSRAYLAPRVRGRAEITRRMLQEVGVDGLIALSGAAAGDVGEALLQGNREQAAKSRAPLGASFSRRLLPRSAALWPGAAGVAGRRHRRSGGRSRTAAGRHASDPVSRTRRLQGARGAGVHCRGLHAR
jgi:DNA polymerase III alpha subunit (gram-positive type)